MKITSLKQLIQELNNCQDGNFGNILTCLELSANQIAHIEQICHWKEGFYSRNLIHRTDKYEALFLCWQPQNISSIHNHAGQDCWVKILQVTCEEKLYLIDETNQHLKLLSSSITTKGTNTYINDNIGLHSIQNIGENKMITLHIYSNPIDSCFVYNNSTHEEKLVQTKYDKSLSDLPLDF